MIANLVPNQPTVESSPLKAERPDSVESSLPGERSERQDDIDGILPIAKSTLFEDWSLPGHGQPYEDCGRFGWKGCLNVDLHSVPRLDVDYSGKVYVKRYRRSCGRASCSVCYEKWASLQAHRAERRLRAFKRGRDRPIHVIVSPDQLSIDRLDYSKLRARVYFVLERVGVYGGICLFHPFREREGGSWYLSPHFHVIGFGWVSRVGQTYRETGWIIKNLGVRKSVFATLQYQLSHAGVHAGKPKRTTVTWFGALSYNKFKFTIEREREVCPICECGLVRLMYVGVGDPPGIDLLEEGEYFTDSKDWSARGEYTS
jgi:hypothetical protein